MDLHIWSWTKICFIIFRFFYDLLRIYQFSTDQFYTKNIGKYLQQQKYNKIFDIFYLLHGSTYVELNKICFVIFRFFYE